MAINGRAHTRKRRRTGLGDREVYQRYFREAYEHGYADGYAGN